jgi:hypothetical protein
LVQRSTAQPTTTMDQNSGNRPLGAAIMACPAR